MHTVADSTFIACVFSQPVSQTLASTVYIGISMPGMWPIWYKKIFS